MTEQFDNYRSRLAGKSIAISVEPQSGYYKMKRGENYHVGVAIYDDDDGNKLCFVGPEREFVDAAETWLWCAKEPIAEDYAREYFETGEWPDLPEVLSNLPSDPYEALLAEIDDKMRQAEEWLKYRDIGIVGTAVEANWARNIENQLRDLKKQADDNHKNEKAPHRAAATAVDEKYRFRSDMEPMIKRLKIVWGKYAAEQEARLQQDRDDEAKVSVGGGYGRRGSLTTVYTAEIGSWPAAAAHYSNDADVRKAVQKAANAEGRAKKDGAAAPGVTFRKERVAR